ncbi:MAG TPA: PQQ-dependent sugar dehydrogenase [Gemmatimonadales bacterium]|nr:PQQ-dependent sugar dehydrogenase [Gemmatimonadales bacterium]
MLPSPLRPLGLTTAVAALLAGCGSSSAPRPPEDALTLVPVDSGYDFSVFVTAPPGDTHRLLVVERGGRIRLRKDGVLQDSAFLNLTGLTNPSTGEYGVYSLAFHPDYATNRRLFVYYADLNGDSQLAEYQADASFDHADPTSRRTILSQAQDPTTVLYGGLVSFGPDGMLYLGLGDGSPISGIWDRAQDSTSLLGKILRLDVDAAQPYAIPADNPYVGRAGWRGEIWQLGLRNPWRWSFDRGTGDLWIGDVGEDSWEEIDHLPVPVVGGNNFGWPTEEGSHCYQPATGCFVAGLVPPILEYPHSPACAVAGGYVYRGRRYPALRGTYFYGDYCGGWIRSVRLDAGTPVPAYPALASPLVNDNVVSFGEDADGEVYVVMASGRIYRIALAG